MVSTHQKYLCPDYMSPLANSLDSNKSPLALLAQTCNSIGLPEVPTTSNNGTNSNGKSSTKSSEGTPSKQEKFNKDESSKSQNCKTSSSQADSTSDAGESSGKSSAGGKDTPTDKKSHDSSNKANSTTGDDSAVTTDQQAPSTSSADPKVVNSSAAAMTNGAAAAMAAMSAAAKCGTCVTPAAYPPPHLFSHYLTAQPTAATAPAFLYGHGLMGGMPVTSCYPGFAAGVPQATMPGAGAYPRLCMDPFCKSCPPNPAAFFSPLVAAAPNPAAAARPCPLGCAQCTSHPLDLSLWLNSYSSMLQNPAAGFHQMAANPNSAALAAAAAAAAAVGPFGGHFSPAAMANSQSAIPPVCWWNSGEGYCLKRFSSAEELLQHLRTHAHESASKNSLLNQPLSQLNSGAPPGGRLSPRSSSYLNSINSLRYHPYSKLSPTVSVATGLPAAYPGLSPFPGLNSAAAFGLPSSLYSTGPTRLPGSLPHP